MVIAELLPAVAPPVMVVPSRPRCSVAPLLPDLPQRSSSALTPTEVLEVIYTFVRVAEVVVLVA